MKYLSTMTFFVAFLFVSMAHAGKTTLPKFGAQNEGKKIAIVSVSANNWSNSLDSINSKDGSELMQSKIDHLLFSAVDNFKTLGLEVVPVSSYIQKKEFQVLAGDQREVALPEVDGVTLPLMAANRKQMVKCRLDKDRAINLAKVTGADFVAVIYSEWAVATGKWVPTSKALAKNVVGIYDSKGKQVYFGRSDKKGRKTLGAAGIVAVNEGTIEQWVMAYDKGLDALFAGRR